MIDADALNRTMIERADEDDNYCVYEEMELVSYILGKFASTVVEADKAESEDEE